MQIRCAWRLTAAALAAGVLSACSGGGGAASSKASSSPASAPALSTATAAPSAAPSPTPSSTPVRSGPPTQAELAGALLGLADMPTGYSVDNSAIAQARRAVASSTLPGCTALVGMFNADKPATATANASVSLDGGADNTSVDESLEAFATPDAARAELTQESSAVQSCPKLTIRVPDVGKVGFTVAQVSFPQVGDSTFAIRFTATSGELAGIELLAVASSKGEVVVRGQFFDALPEESENIMRTAVAKVTKSLGSGTA